MQLKGSGRTPYSRGFDGRAVFRSSVREFLASEAMHNLNIPTTRALCIIGTEDTRRRPWYQSQMKVNNGDGGSNKKTSRYRGGKYSPDRIVYESGAVLCRVSESGFLRFSQFELFSKRKENSQLKSLLDYAIEREFPFLLQQPTATNNTKHESIVRYITLFKEIAKLCAFLLVDWQRVGFVQGNMNSDNILITGCNIDYGPFGFMEMFDPKFQPFTSDANDLKYCYANQPYAMLINLSTLKEAFLDVINYVFNNNEDSSSSDKVVKEGEVEGGYKLADYLKQIEDVVDKEYPQYYSRASLDMKRAKLGFRPSKYVKHRNSSTIPLPQSMVMSSEDKEEDSEGERKFGDEEGSSSSSSSSSLWIIHAIDEPEEMKIGKLYQDLEGLMVATKTDFTIFFRLLSDVAYQCSSPSPLDIDTGALEKALLIVLSSFYIENNEKDDKSSSSGSSVSDSDSYGSIEHLDSKLRDKWKDWFKQYLTLLQSENREATNINTNNTNNNNNNNNNNSQNKNVILTKEERKKMQDSTNPKIILRNWMAVLAYEENDNNNSHSLIHELNEVLETPYADYSGSNGDNKWFRKTPSWAINLPGSAFLS